MRSCWRCCCSCCSGAAELVRLNRIYTRTGDAGETGLVDGSRRAKSDPLIAAIGEVDEANCAVGLALPHVAEERLRAMLLRIQNELFDLGADLATPAGIEGALRILPEQSERLEREIDEMNGSLEPLRSFVLPGGGAAAAHLHFARAVARRAERAMVAAGGVSAPALAYANRLSDHLFVMARLAAAREGGDLLWRPGATREG